MESSDPALVGRKARGEIVVKSSNKYGREEKMRKREKRGGIGRRRRLPSPANRVCMNGGSF